jgi:hypothetical protein
MWAMNHTVAFGKGQEGQSEINLLEVVHYVFRLSPPSRYHHWMPSEIS